MDEHGAEVSAEAMAARLAAGLGALAGLMETPGAKGSLPAFAAQMRAMRDDAHSLAEALAGVPGDEGGEAPDDQAERPAGALAGQAATDMGEGIAAPQIVLLLPDALAAAQHIRPAGAPDWQAAKAAADAAAEQDRREGRLSVVALRLALDVLAHGARRQVETMAGRDQAERQEAADGVAAAYARLGVTLAALDRFARRLSKAEKAQGLVNPEWIKDLHPDFWAAAEAANATH